MCFDLGHHLVEEHIISFADRVHEDRKSLPVGTCPQTGQTHMSSRQLQAGKVCSKFDGLRDGARVRSSCLRADVLAAALSVNHPDHLVNPRLGCQAVCSNLLSAHKPWTSMTTFCQHYTPTQIPVSTQTMDVNDNFLSALHTYTNSCQHTNHGRQWQLFVSTTHLHKFLSAHRPWTSMITLSVLHTSHVKEWYFRCAIVLSQFVGIVFCADLK